MKIRLEQYENNLMNRHKLTVPLKRVSQENFQPLVICSSLDDSQGTHDENRHDTTVVEADTFVNHAA
jgi:hypothetical protein